MDKQEQMLLRLQGEIDQKCIEITQKRKQERLTKLFLVTSILLLTLPVILIFSGFNPFIMLAPIAVYFSIAILVLSPLLLHKNQYVERVSL